MPRDDFGWPTLRFCFSQRVGPLFAFDSCRSAHAGRFDISRCFQFPIPVSRRAIMVRPTLNHPTPYRPVRMMLRKELTRTVLLCYCSPCIANLIPAFKRSAISTSTVLSSLLCFHTVTNCPLLPFAKHPLRFHALTNCPFSIPFVLTFMHRMGGVGGPAVLTLTYCLESVA